VAEDPTDRVRAWDERYAATELVWSAGPNQFVEAHLAGLPPGRALDLAAGEGRNALWLAEQGWDVTAVDFSEVGLDKGRAVAERRGLKVNWVTADVLSYDVEPGSFDLAVLAYLQLPHEQGTTAVRRAFAALRTGGTLFVVGHDSSNLTEGTGGPQDPAVLFTAEDVLTALEGERFEVLHADRVARVVLRDGDERTAYDALVRVVRAD
jgi:SAM-dependent methyltransferase